MGIQVVSFHCVLKNKLGQVISTTYNQGVLNHPMNSQDRLGVLAVGLKDLKKGEKRKIFLRADEAYGFYDPSKVITCHMEDLQHDQPLKCGDSVVVQRHGARLVSRIVEISEDSVTLDANHPLAGQDLLFEIEATEAREATPEEIAESMEPEENSARFLH